MKGGFYFSPSDGEQLITRLKEAYDGAIPSGNSIALLNLPEACKNHRKGSVRGDGRSFN